MNETFVKSAVKATASKDLENSVKKELDLPDPVVVKAKAIITDNKKDDEDGED